MDGRLEIVRDPAPWAEVLERVVRPSVVATHRFVAATAALAPGHVAELAVWSDDKHLLAHPYVCRPIPDAPGLFDLVSAYDSTGFFCSTNDETAQADLLRGFEKAISTHARDAHYVSEFCRIHPFRRPPLEAFSLYKPIFVTDNVIIGLQKPYEEIWRNYKPTRRQHINQGRRNGLRVEPSRDFRLFLEIYHRNLDRLNANADYYFPLSFLETLSPFLELHYLHSASGELVAAHTYLLDHEAAFAFLCHANVSMQSLRPNDFLYDHFAQEFRSRGFSTFHLGGGAPSLKQFKAHFSPERVPYYVAQAVFLPDTYAELTRQHAEASGLGEPSKYFPAYRETPAFVATESVRSET